MLIYLFVNEGRPQAHTDLHIVQGVLEEKLRDRREVSEVWWDDTRPYEARVYLYDSKHWMFEEQPDGPGEHAIDFETTDQLIWPVEIGDKIDKEGS